MTLYEELAKTHPPANACERMLLTQVAASWERLERAHELERQYFKGRDMAEIVRTKLDEFKAITRYVTDCERAWRHALLNLEKAQRRRQRDTARPADVAKLAEAGKAKRAAAATSLPQPPVTEVAYPIRP